MVARAHRLSTRCVSTSLFPRNYRSSWMPSSAPVAPVIPTIRRIPSHHIQYPNDSYTNYSHGMTKVARWASLTWDDSLPFQLRRASQAWTALWLKRVPDLTNPQFAVLLLLGQHGALDQSELGILASVDRATISGLVDRLEARGLVSKTTDPNNRRRRIIELTDH